MHPGLSRSAATRFIILLGTVSLFADITYEGMRGVIGPYFVTLGSPAAVVGLIAGAGELLAFALRLGTGYLADRTRAYWTLTIAGYAINLLAVPALALATDWRVAAVLVLLERTGKSIRGPARDVMLSQAAQTVGRGWGFGLHAAMDQIGAIAGPLLMAAVLARTHEYADAFRIAAIPAALALVTLFIARGANPHPDELAPAAKPLPGRGFNRQFWLYVWAGALLAAGFADFPLIAYHLEKQAILAPAGIPLLYSCAMGMNAVFALVFGRLYDRYGAAVMAAGALCGAAGLPAAFFGGLGGAIAGMCLWGAAMGAMDSVLRAGIASMTTAAERGSAFGAFHAVYGVAWFAGSATMGRLYDWSTPALVGFGVAAQAAAAAMFVYYAARYRRAEG